jgi:uncharacterized protein with FMN-binding domain
VRRAILALVGTATSTVLLVGAKAGHATGAAPARQVPAADHASTSAGTTPHPGTNATTPAPPAAGAPAPGNTTAPGSTPTAARPHTDYLQDGSWPGSAAYTDYGFVELKITVANKKITDVITLDYPNDRSESQRISGNAVKKLRTEALAAQSADIRSVSGASETSAAYKTSLQAAINVAHGG